MRTTLRHLLCASVIVSAIGVCSAGEAPVLVLVDSSRSVKPAEFSALVARLGEALRALPPGVTGGLLEFNDAPRWVVPMGSSMDVVAGALAGVSQGGRHTLMRDALVAGARALPAGGVLLLMTDGKDEGSVATLSDVTTLCDARHASVATLAMGRAPSVRTLRRVATLTGGRYLGTIDKASPGAIATAVGELRQELVASLPAVPPAPSPVPVAPTVAAPAEGAAPAPATAPEPAPTAAPLPASTSPNVLPIVLGLVGLVAAVVALLVWRSRKGPSGRVCPECGQPMAAWEQNCSNCAIERLQLRQAESAAQPAPPAEPLQPEVEIFDATEFAKLPTEERLEKTFSLEEHAVLIVRQQRRPVRTFALDPTKVIHAGRAGTVNTVAIEDPSVSGQHFKIVPKDGEFFILDLDSTNGTFVNGERVKVRKLKSGDTIMAGQVECEFRMQFVRRA